MERWRDRSIGEIKQKWGHNYQHVIMSLDGHARCEQTGLLSNEIIIWKRDLTPVCGPSRGLIFGEI